MTPAEITLDEFAAIALCGCTGMLLFGIQRRLRAFWWLGGLGCAAGAALVLWLI
jgi:hypothetical protein